MSVGPFAWFLQSLRHQQQLPLRRFCERFGLDPGTYSKMERGLRPPPKSRQAQDKLAHSSAWKRVRKRGGRLWTRRPLRPDKCLKTSSTTRRWQPNCPFSSARSGREADRGTARYGGGVDEEHPSCRTGFVGFRMRRSSNMPKSFYSNTGTTPCLLMSSTSPNTASRSVSCPYLD